MRLDRDKVWVKMHLDNTDNFKLFYLKGLQYDVILI